MNKNDTREVLERFRDHYNKNKLVWRDEIEDEHIESFLASLPTEEAKAEPKPECPSCGGESEIEGGYCFDCFKANGGSHF